MSKSRSSVSSLGQDSISGGGLPSPSWSSPRSNCDVGLRTPSLEVKKVELRLYRRLRTSADVSPCPAHFVYHIGCSWSGLPTAGAPPRLHRAPELPRSFSFTSSARSMTSQGERPLTSSALSSSTSSTASTSCSSSWRSSLSSNSGEAWWHDLPANYTIKRRWADIARFHEALVNELAYDQELKRSRVKARVPPLPAQPDGSAWLLGYAAVGDAFALGRQQPLNANPDRQQPMEELDRMQYLYMENRLGPYFQQVNAVLAELPPEVALNSRALKRFFTSGGVSGRAPLQEDQVKPIPTRFLGPLVPAMPDREDLLRAALKRRSNSTPGLSKNKTEDRSGSKLTGNLPKLSTN
mmetsp:Transcript_89489/g.186960  ORF Transcript_89489/g.186960 Transcript_89489/m.186960 type:complete len:352 (+) Transcript_89489:249-1304(+)